MSIVLILPGIEADLHRVEECFKVDFLDRLRHDLIVFTFFGLHTCLINCFTLVQQVLVCDYKLVRVVNGMSLVLFEENSLKQTCDAIHSNDVLDVELL